jgi:membrane associated rhomboid family serine protease
MKKINILIFLCIFISFFYWFINPEFVDEKLIFRAIVFLNGNLWTPITALFVHSNIIHLISNIFFLYSFGNTLEDELGVEKTLTAFFVGGISSFILSIFFYGLNVSMIGASAAIFTLSAVVMFTKPLKFSWQFFMPLGLVAILYFIYNLLAAYYNLQGNIGYIAHVIGFTVGIPFGIAWNKKWIKNLLITVILLIFYTFLILSFELFKKGI